MEQEIMTYDVIIVGAGPAGLSAGIRIKQKNPNLRVCIFEKGAQVGSHLISGAVLNPSVLQTLLPDTFKNAPLNTPVTEDAFYFLTETKEYKLPTPPQMKNEGNYIISLGELGQFLAREAEALGCEIYAGFAAKSILFNDKNEVIGIVTGEFGLDKSGEKTANYQPSMQIHAKQTLFAEGARGELSQKLIAHFALRADNAPQTYGLGIKEIWRIDEKHHKPGTVVHTVGWPLDTKTYGGSFIYHLSNQTVAIGFVTGLDYENTYLSPFEEMQRFKTHPFIRPMLEGGERISYGARALNEGGWQSIPKLTFAGGALIGDSAGFLNTPQIKGIHFAMQSGIYAADACVKHLESATLPIEITTYPETFETSWMAKSLYEARNIRPGFKWGLIPGLINAAFETYISRGRSPWTLKHQNDYQMLRTKYSSTPIDYPKPDGKITFDRLSSVYLSNMRHEENQPSHLKFRNDSKIITVNYKQYASPETRYCPAAVYEIVDEESGNPRLQVNAGNCIQCKTCDIKDPTQNIVWTAPEGGSGPNYTGM